MPFLDPANTRRLRNMAVLGGVAAIALAVAWRSDIRVFPPIQVTGTIMRLSAAVLIGVMALNEVLLLSRPAEDRQNLWMRQVIPQNGADRILWLTSAAVTGVAEEIIFRGVLFAFLVLVTDSIPAAAIISATIFAAAHYRQGWKAMLIIFGIALLFQWLVITAASLVPAMVIHAVYNVLRGIRATKGLRH